MGDREPAAEQVPVCGAVVARGRVSGCWALSDQIEWVEVGDLLSDVNGKSEDPLAVDENMEGIAPNDGGRKRNLLLLSLETRQSLFDVAECCLIIACPFAIVCLAILCLWR
jgi:hypothetical protein